MQIINVKSQRIHEAAARRNLSYLYFLPIFSPRGDACALQATDQLSDYCEITEVHEAAAQRDLSSLISIFFSLRSETSRASIFFIFYFRCTARPLSLFLQALPRARSPSHARSASRAPAPTRIFAAAPLSLPVVQ
jgi:hypothetical protein